MMMGCLVCAAIRPHAGVSAVRRQRSKAECSLDVATVETPRPLGTRLLSDLVRGWRPEGSAMKGFCRLRDIKVG